MNRTQLNGQARRPRQNPVSCQLCRQKKLRCNRQQPCSNCSARGIGCQFATEKPTQQTTDSGQGFPQEEKAALLARLAKLEDAVFGKHDSRPSASTTILSSPPQPSTPPMMPIFTFNEEHEVASKWLEGIGTLENSIFPGHSNGIKLRAEPISQLLTDPSAARNGAAHLSCCAQLPTKVEATNLFQYFLDNVQYLHPVLQPQSVESTIDTVYMNHFSHLRNKPADIALLLSIFASASHLWRPHRSKVLIFQSTQEAASMSSIWGIAALDLLEYSRRTTFASVEHLQATIIISYVIYNSQGFSPMFRSLHSNMITMAWELSLHKTDSPQMKGQTDSQPSRIEAEVKRRIWWHIASTDWLLAFTPGPLEGTYSIQPSHMRVNHPQDEEDRDHNDGNLALLSTSYFLQRVRLSEICRAVVDSLPQFEDVENVDYRQIISLDGKFEELIEKLPAFFRLDDGSDLYHTAPHLAIQRYLIHLGIHTRRSRLHQSFLVRGFTDPKYAFSRDACLNSSRTVLEICRTLEEEKNSLASIPARLATVVHHLFMATVALVVDLCSTKVEGFEEQRQAEVTQACRMLDDLKNDSTMAARFLNPLMEILQKHKDRLHHQSAVSARVPTDSRISQSLRDPLRVLHEPLSDIGQDTSANPGGQRAAAGQSYADDWEFDHMMQQYIDLGQNIDGPTWNNLFDDFDSYQMSDVGGAIFYG